jgi:hypothetical protein
MEVHACNLSYTGSGDKRITVQDPSRQKHETLSEKQTKSQRTGDVAQVIVLLTKHEALSSIPSATNKQKI